MFGNLDLAHGMLHDVVVTFESSLELVRVNKPSRGAQALIIALYAERNFDHNLTLHPPVPKLLQWYCRTC